MRWKGRRESTNIDDRRGRTPRGRPVAIGGGAILLVVLAVAFLGGDPAQVLEILGDAGDVGVDLSQPQQRLPNAPAPDDEQARMVAVVLADTEETWGRVFRDLGQTYYPPTLVLFNDAVQSACGFNSAAVGPFYCPADLQVYIDLGFFRELNDRFGAPGDFAQAYVVAHEIGHHVQKLLGISDQVHELRARSNEATNNTLSVRLELQADCLAGVWGHHAGSARNLLEQGDVEEGLRAAAAIGDDTIQRRSQGRVSPESWTHGSSEQRVRWFRRGLDTGDIRDCDTFAAEAR